MATRPKKEQQTSIESDARRTKTTTTAQLSYSSIHSTLKHLIMEDTAIFADTQFRIYCHAFEGLFSTCYHQYRTLRTCLMVWDESIRRCEQEMTKIPLVRTLQDQKVTMFSPLRTTQDAIIAQIDSLPKDMRCRYTYAFVRIAEDVIGEVDHRLWPRGMALANAVKRWNSERIAADQARSSPRAPLTPEQKRLYEHLRGLMGRSQTPGDPRSPSDLSDCSSGKIISPGNLATTTGSPYKNKVDGNLAGLMAPPQSPAARRSSNRSSDYSLGNSGSPGYLRTSTGSPRTPGYARTPSNLGVSTGSPPVPGSAKMSGNSWSPMNCTRSPSPMPSSNLGTPSRHRRSSGPPIPSTARTLLDSEEPSKLLWYPRDADEGKMGPPLKKHKVEHVTDEDNVPEAGGGTVSFGAIEQPPEIPSNVKGEPPHWTAINASEQEAKVKIESPPGADVGLSTPDRIRMTGYDPRVKIEAGAEEESPSKSQSSDVTPPKRAQPIDDSPSKREWWANVMNRRE